MRLLYILLMMCVAAGSGLQGKAQSNHVYEDSSILYPPGETASPEIIEEENISVVTQETADKIAGENSSYSDTFLVSNRHFLSADSIRFLKEDKQFLYAKNLDSLLQHLKKKEEEKEKKRRQNDTSGSSSDNSLSARPTFLEKLFTSQKLQYILWGLAGLFVLFVVYKLAFTADGFRKQAKEHDSNVKVMEEEDMTPVPGKNFDAAISKAKSENNHRLAVRYLYLQLLQRLTAAGAIEFAVDKTNTEYLRELTGKPYKEGVAELTRYYDYVWYGEFEMDAAVYAKVENKFKNLVI